MASEENNPRIFPRDNNVSDELSQDFADKTATQTMIEPKMPEENDEGAMDGKESRRIDPETKYPKSTFSAWYKHLEGLSMCNDESKRQIAETCLEPRHFPSCAASTETGWNFIRHGLDEFPNEQKAVDDKIEKVWSISFGIADAYAKNENKDFSVKPSEVMAGISLIREIWRDIFSTMNKLGLSFRFRKADEEMLALKKRLREDPLRKNIVMAKGEDLNPVTKPLEVKK
jgi:hypothetical protein